MGVERQLLAYVAKKYPQPLHKALHNPYFIPNEGLQLQIKNEKTLIQLLSHLPHWGIGRIVTSLEWSGMPATFWRITRVHVDYATDGFKYGLVWGVFTDKGRCHYYEEEITAAKKYLWRLIPKHEEQHYINCKPKSKEFNEVPLNVTLPPLLSRMKKVQKSKELGVQVFEKEPMVRLLIERGVNNIDRQKLSDGSWV